MELPLKIFDKNQAESLINYRSHEIKLGQKIRVMEAGTSADLNRLHLAGVKYVILGVEECIGPLANLGNQGAQNAWQSFLVSFLNTQFNDSINPNLIAVLGSVDTDEEQEIGLNLSDKNKDYHKNLRQIVNDIDEKVAQVLDEIYALGMVPIVIGGGHNNAYPLLAASSKQLKSKINVVNLDPHGDCRPLEGRHSGNSFSYAFENGFINQYHVVGLHRNYNSHAVMHFLDDNENCSYRYFDEIVNWPKEIDTAYQQITASKSYLGVELDLDAIAYMPSSAISPLGFSLLEAAQYLKKMASYKQLAYLHLPEAAPVTDMEKKMVGKALTYLVTEFLRDKLN